MSSHDSDCWLTIDGVVPIEQGKQHRDYFVPDNEKSSTQFGLDLGNIRVCTLGTFGRTLHFEFKKLSPQTSRLIADALKQSRAKFINLESHVPRYALRSNLNLEQALSILEECSQCLSLTVKDVAMLSAMGIRADEKPKEDLRHLLRTT